MDPMMGCYHQYFDNSEAHLPPGFRFHPTDEELITYYLLKKVLDGNFTGRAIAEVDLNKCEPWELPEKAKMGEKEWYFYSLRDRKYPTGLRTNRATEAGYWKATGKDREIYSSKTCSLVGMKKTLVFYRGRAPKGEKSSWVMHEYRLEGKLSYHYLPRISKDEWVISRVFQKSGAGTGSAVHGGGGKSKSSRMSLFQEVGSPSSVSLPPLPDSSPYSAAMTDRDGFSYDSQTSRQHVSCFSTVSAAASGAAGFKPDHDRHPPPPFDLNPAPEGLDPSCRFPRNAGFSAFPSLRSLEENLQLPLFLSSSPAALTMHGGAGGLNVGGFSSGNWVGPEERVEGGRMGVGPTELDCMWTN